MYQGMTKKIKNSETAIFWLAVHRKIFGTYITYRFKFKQSCSNQTKRRVPYKYGHPFLASVAKVCCFLCCKTCLFACVLLTDGFPGFKLFLGKYFLYFLITKEII